MKTYSLDINAEEHFDFDIFSITCTESIYRVVHELNQALNIDLQLNDLLDFTHKEGEDFYFPLYGFIHDELNIEFNLLPNQTSFQQPTLALPHARHCTPNASAFSRGWASGCQTQALQPAPPRTHAALPNHSRAF